MSNPRTRDPEVPARLVLLPLGVLACAVSASLIENGILSTILWLVAVGLVVAITVVGYRYSRRARRTPSAGGQTAQVVDQAAQTSVDAAASSRGISQFDHVRILATPLTEARGYAGRIGTCYGFTTPSMTGIGFLGESDEDLAFNVDFEAPDEDNEWFAPDLVEFMDHAPGSEVEVGDLRFIRAENGDWLPVEDTPEA